MSANGISHLPTKQQRQIAKLNLAANNRAAFASISGNAQVADDRNTYVTAELPTVYTGNTVTTQSHPGGLIQGRPWIDPPPYSTGVYFTIYNNWPNTNVATPGYFATGTVSGHGTGNNFSASLTAAQTSIAYQYLGYFKPNYTGTWTIYATGVDDAFAMWIGSNAVTGYTTGNALLNVSDTSASATINLTAGTYYPFRAQYANNQGPGSYSLSYSHPGQIQTTNWNGLLFYNSATNGF